VTSTCYVNIVTVKKMLSLIEEQNKVKTVPKIGLSAVGLTAFAKKSGMTSGWESGDEFMLVCGKLDIEFFSGKFTKYMQLVNRCSPEAMNVLRLDDDSLGDKSVYTMKALIPKDKSSEDDPL